MKKGDNKFVDDFMLGVLAQIHVDEVLRADLKWPITEELPSDFMAIVDELLVANDKLRRYAGDFLGIQDFKGYMEDMLERGDIEELEATLRALPMGYWSFRITDRLRKASREGQNDN